MAISKQNIKTVINKTNGAKTPSVALAFIAVKILENKIPFLAANEELVETILIALFSGTLGHRIIRHAKIAYNYINNKLKSNIMSKDGLVTREEFKFFTGLIVGEFEIPTIWKPAVKWVLPAVLDGIDNKYGDKIPEPWQTHLEHLTTMLYDAMQDKVIDMQEQEEIIAYCTVVMNEKIDIPVIGEEDEAVAFMLMLQLLATLIRSAVNKLKKAE